MPEQVMRILRFPADCSLGWVHVPRTAPDLVMTHWDRLGDAQGNVAVPIGMPVRLVVDIRVATDLSLLGALEPDDLQRLYLVQTRVTDDQLVHVARLTGLEHLSLAFTDVSDAGLAVLQPLHRLRRLHLNATQVSDEGLGYLHAFPDLESLALGATLVTDHGLPHLYGLRKLGFLSFDAAYSGRQSRVTPAGISDLRRALPHCRLDLDWD
jgi:hypothetical protein